MGYVNCAVTASSDTSIECTLDHNVPGGTWLPQVKDEHGLVKVADGVADHIVNSTVTSVSPDTNLNPAGGQTITVTGTNLPPTNDPRYSYYKFYLDEGQQNECIIQTYSTTEFTCISQPFVSTRRRLLQEGRSVFI
jgi:hypothetical protein